MASHMSFCGRGCEHGKETFDSIIGQRFVEQQFELRSFVDKISTEFLHKLLSYAVIPDVLLTK
jgi:hypothetical protein